MGVCISYYVSHVTVELSDGSIIVYAYCYVYIN